MTVESISFEALVEARKRSAQTCSELQSRTKRRFPYGLETALELQGVEKPNLPPGMTAYKLPVAVLPNVNAKTHLTGINRVIWSFPIETIHIAGTYLCTNPACTWAMYSHRLDLQELVVLGDSMTRRDRRLKCASVDDLAEYLERCVLFAQGGKLEGRSVRMFPGYRNCVRALRLIRENTDSSQETRTRLVLPRYGLDIPLVNYPLSLPGRLKSLYLDMAYPEFKLCIEYEGAHHAGQWLSDIQRRQLIEQAGWYMIQVTKYDLVDKFAEANLAERIANMIGQITGKTVPLTEQKSVRQISDTRRLNRKPLWKRLKFQPLLPPGMPQYGDFDDFGLGSELG